MEENILLEENKNNFVSFPKRKRFYVPAIIISVCLLFLIIFNLQVSLFVQRFTADLYFKNATSFTNTIYRTSLKNPIIKNYLSKKGLDKYDTSTKSELLAFIQKNDIQGLKIVQEEVFESKEILEFEKSEQQANFLPESQNFIREGKNGFIHFEHEVINKYSKSNTQSKELKKIQIDRVEPEDEIKYIGTGEDNDIKNKVKNNITEILNKAYEENKYSVHSVDFREKVIKNEENVKIGNVGILIPNCSYYIKQDLYYSLESEVYEISKPLEIKQYECDENISLEKPVQLAICTDCYLFPVDKENRLKETYIPEISKIEHNGDEYEFAAYAKQDLQNLLSEALKYHHIHITSAYRSYENQVETFEYWTLYNQQVYGLSYEEAIVKANTISAKPGYSEHQLGTTIDFNALECNAFEGYCEANEKLWDWLKNNAHKYGFVLSYPKGKEDQTGYSFEPWHYRWIGKELAEQFFNVQDEYTLNVWLRNL